MILLCLFLIIIIIIILRIFKTKYFFQSNITKNYLNSNITISTINNNNGFKNNSFLNLTKFLKTRMNELKRSSIEYPLPTEIIFKE